MLYLWVRACGCFSLLALLYQLAVSAAAAAAVRVGASSARWCFAVIETEQSQTAAQHDQIYAKAAGLGRLQRGSGRLVLMLWLNWQDDAGGHEIASSSAAAAVQQPLLLNRGRLLRSETYCSGSSCCNNFN
jgi:hypothetical protein